MLDDGRPGTVAQSLGIARALGLPFVRRHLVYGPAVHLPNALRRGPFLGLDALKSDPMSGPWPSVVIAAGRRAAPVALAIRQRGYGDMRLVQVMGPGLPTAHFDAVVLPAHDLTSGTVESAELAENLFPVLGAPVSVTPDRLALAKEEWRGKLAALPGPKLAVFLGGAGKGKPMSPAAADRLGQQVQALATALGGSVMATSSRRTGAAATRAFFSRITGPSVLYDWARAEAGEPNPYEGMVAHADAIFVSRDSISMACEAAAATCPLYLFDPTETGEGGGGGRLGRKHARFADDMVARGMARIWQTGTTPDLDWSHAPLTEAARVAEHLKARFGW